MAHTNWIALWRRLDTPGHDACRCETDDAGHHLDGTAVFRVEGTVACLAYRVGCDSGWRTTDASVRGFVGSRHVEISIERRPAGTWVVNGNVSAGLESCEHVDFGFTPATNFLQLQAMALQPSSGRVHLPVAWLDVPPADLRVLPQWYQRRGSRVYWYESPTFGYSAELEVEPAGFIRRYPGLWVLED